MFDFFKKVFGTQEEAQNEISEDIQSHDVRVAVCALFLEMATIDSEFDKDEWESILAILKDNFGLSEEYAVQLTEAAAKVRDESLDIWKFTNQINDNYSVDEKIRVVEMLWRIVYADGRLDKHEDYLVRKCARLLNLKDSQLIAAKLAAKDEK